MLVRGRAGRHVPVRRRANWRAVGRYLGYGPGHVGDMLDDYRRIDAAGPGGGGGAVLRGVSGDAAARRFRRRRRRLRAVGRRARPVAGASAAGRGRSAPGLTARAAARAAVGATSFGSWCGSGPYQAYETAKPNARQIMPPTASSQKWFAVATMTTSVAVG